MIRTFEEFWPVYLSYHCDARAKNLRLVAGAAAAAAIGIGAAKRDGRIAAAAPLLALVGPAVANLRSAAHRELLYLHPRWTIRAELRVTRLSVTGQLDDELARYGIFSDTDIVDITPGA